MYARAVISRESGDANQSGLAGRAFTPEDIRIITDAYNAVVAHLELQSQENKEKAAKVVAALAGENDKLDVSELLHAAMKQLKDSI